MSQTLGLLRYGIQRFVFAVRLGVSDSKVGRVRSWREAEDAIWDIDSDQLADEK